ncbi:alpha-mannosidase 2 [Scaptodrosophila lebanonensis]|uniref:Alpha-mannosidase n=1 Tax=Drosophila lebanonensis TaxID=7225 RepID=A0A6J2TET8_DROLE|nr:alpha-mannosidase 2 [Scaptodrosophila lebanonensis]XP_030373940.1 alpha-mannosidase 2 [Scaptodrosophila lebanonensis]XP_030373941.1 alpha-mannosidase 2 [Scaptodrosophila lebanonensis]
MTFKLFRRGSARCIGLLSAFVTILLCLYYISIGQPNTTPITETNASGRVVPPAGFSVGGGAASHLQQQQQQQQLHVQSYHAARQKRPVPEQHLHQQQDMENSIEDFDNAAPQKNNPNWGDKCYVLLQSETNVTAAEEYSKFDFQPEWIRSKEYWDRGFEERFEAQKKDKHRPPLKVIVVPHSHNDPGWLKTFTNYFQSDSRQILNLLVTKMQEYKDMTFIWSEISFLQLWWDQAHPTKQRAFKRLINSGRIEITTGGWVMTDEANVHIYPMLDQLIEGHQWLRNNLNVTPKVGWSIDPFGHGSTVPYLLSGANFEGAIIQRIHYAWKQWFARQQSGDFIWTPYWRMPSTSPGTQHGRLLTHNMPFDIYSIKGSCGPHPFICLNFDFRKIPGEYTEYSVKAQFITNDNVEEKAQLLLEQYSRTASLFPHNVALIPVGDDFRYNKEREVDQQYSNYKKLIDHIMANKRLYNVDISFGTPSDYFKAIRERTAQFPSFKGDFFVYSDIFSEGRPAYWSGYFSTRPFYKLMSSELEHQLRAAEILFTVAYNTARQYRHENAIKIYEKNYEKMIHARRNLGLFQHHDAITGTSKANVMRDYAMRLFESTQDMVKMQEACMELLLQNGSSHHDFLLSEFERDNFSRLPRKMPIQLGGLSGEASTTQSKNADASFVVYNALTHKRIEIVTLRVQQPNVKIFNEHGEELKHIQINPVWNITDPNELGLSGAGTGTGSVGRIRISTRQYEVMFVAELEPLSLTTYRVQVDDFNYKRNIATIYCDDCTDGATSTSMPETTASQANAPDFEVRAKPAGDIQLENHNMRLLFDEKSGFLKTITRKNKQQQLLQPMQSAIRFAAYRSAQFHSGAYLFKTDPEQSEAEKDVLEQYVDVRIIITSGPIASDVTVIYGPFLAHTVRIFNTHTHLDAAIYIENDIDFEPPPKNRETELFMRLVTNIDNIAPAPIQRDVLKEPEGTIPELPVFYSDQNGFQYHERIKVPAIGIEGNYFPITSGAFIQDSHVRLSLLTTHAQGAASYEPGQLEVMLDRRTLYDDYRGMGEGVVDSRMTRHKFWLLVEDMPGGQHVTQPPNYKVPSLHAQQLANTLRYPPNLYFVENFDLPPAQLQSLVRLLPRGALPCDVHLTTLRTLSEPQLQLFPSASALLVLHRQGYDCSVRAQQVDLTGVCTLDGSGLGAVQLGALRLQSIETTTLTGGALQDNERERLRSFSEITLQPMELRTFNLTFRGEL